ncbi:MAG: M48 family metalloprotease [Planctomycetota bacterium]
MLKDLSFQILTVGLLIVFNGCRINPITHKPYFQLISDREEISLGEFTREYVDKEFHYAIFNNKAIEEYISYVGQKLVRVSHRSTLGYTFRILNSDSLNAFALVGGNIYITTGLLSVIENESQLAVVLAHELAHIALHHPGRMLKDSIESEGPLYTIGYLIRKLSTSAKAYLTYHISQVTEMIISGGFSEKDEKEADILMLEYVVRSGYHPSGFVELLKILQKVNKESPELVANFFKTHPSWSKDISAVERSIVEKYKNELEKEILINDSVEFQRIVRNFFLVERIKNIKFEK